MLRQISLREWYEWRAYADLEPFDEVRADLRSGQIVQAIYNVNRGKGKPAIKLQDCVLKFEEEAKATPAQERERTKRIMGMLMDAQKKAPKRKPRQPPARR